MVTLQDNEKLSPSTEAKALRLLRAMLTLAVRHRRLAFNPCEPVESPKDKAGEMLFLTEAQDAGRFELDTETADRMARYLEERGYIEFKGAGYYLSITAYSIDEAEELA